MVSSHYSSFEDEGWWEIDYLGPDWRWVILYNQVSLSVFEI